MKERLERFVDNMSEGFMLHPVRNISALSTILALTTIAVFVSESDNKLLGLEIAAISAAMVTILLAAIYQEGSDINNEQL